MSKNSDKLLEQYKQMQIIRRFEEESARAYAQGKIGGFLHLYIGQEAIAVATDSALEKDDYVFQTYRDHGTAIARGMSPEAAMAELFGRDSGCSRGMGGSMHFFDVENNFLGGWGIIGGHLALAAGAAFKSKYKEDGRVTVCFFGDGSTNIGGFHEALSLAGLWKLPVVFVVENNQYAMGTPLERTSAITDFSIKAEGYGMPGDNFDGHDIEVVEAGMKKAIDRARKGEGPTLINIETYRFRGHSMSDPGKYRTKEELEDRKKRDPLLVAREKLMKMGVSEDQIDDIDAEVDERIEAVVKFADEAPLAKEEVMYGSVYAPSDISPVPTRGEVI